MQSRKVLFGNVRDNNDKRVDIHRVYCRITDNLQLRTTMTRSCSIFCKRIDVTVQLCVSVCVPLNSWGSSLYKTGRCQDVNMHRDVNMYVNEYAQ